MVVPTADREPLTWPVLRHYYQHNKISTYLRPLPDYGVIYVKNPKAGCTTLMIWLDRIHTGELDRAYRDVHKEHRLPTVGDVGRHKVLRMLAGDAYRFTFVRNPARRLESFYRDKLHHAVDSYTRWRPKFAEPLNQNVDDFISFDRFLGVIEQQDPYADMNPHWRPQHVNLIHPLVGYDYIGKLETFDADIKRITEETRLPTVPIEAHNVTLTDRDSVYDNKPGLLRRVEALYATDYELYGY